MKYAGPPVLSQGLAPAPEPERWSDSAQRSGAAEHAFGAAFRLVRDATEPSETSLARVGRRLGAGSRSRAGARLWRLALAVALVMATGGVVAAALNKWRAIQRIAAPAESLRESSTHRVRGGHRHQPHREEAMAPTVPTTLPTAGDNSAMQASVAVAAPPAEAPTAAGPPPVAANESMPAFASVPALARVPVPAPASKQPSLPSLSSSPSKQRGWSASLRMGASRVAHAAPLAAPGPSAAAPPSESAELADVFRTLRVAGDPAAALRALDGYDGRYPTGALRSEARIARVEALLALDRRGEALAILDDLAPPGAGLTRNVLVTRAELRAERGRCAQALVDFDRLLAASVNDDANGRALYGRAGCRLRAGDAASARRDLQRYLMLAPDGVYAPAARQMLHTLP